MSRRNAETLHTPRPRPRLAGSPRHKKPRRGGAELGKRLDRLAVLALSRCLRLRLLDLFEGVRSAPPGTTEGIGHPFGMDSALALPTLLAFPEHV